MRYAEAIVERLFYPGGIPTTKPAEILVGKILREMIECNIKDEENAITLYSEIIAQARVKRMRVRKILRFNWQV